MDKSTLEKIVKAAVKIAREQTVSAKTLCSAEESRDAIAGPIAAVLVEQAISNELIRKALLS